MKKILFLFSISIILFSCKKDVQIDCSDPNSTYICFDNDGRKTDYNSWFLDTVATFNVFNVSGSKTPTPGTTGPWTTVTIYFINDLGNMALQTGEYTYRPFLENVGERNFNFTVRHFTGDDQNPTITNWEKSATGNASFSIESIDGLKLTGLFYAEIQNIANTNEKATVRYRFVDIEP